MFSFGFSLVIAALVGMILYSYLRNRKVSAPRLPGNDGGNIGYAGGAEYQEPSPEYQYFESRREAFLDQLYSRTSSPEIPVTLTLRDWVDQGFYAEGGAYWAAAQQFTYYLIEGGYVRAYDTEGDELTAQRVLTDRPAALQLTPSEYQRRRQTGLTIRYSRHSVTLRRLFMRRGCCGAGIRWGSVAVLRGGR